MSSFIFAVLLLIFSLLGITLRKIYFYLPSKELKRQAESGDKLAGMLWRAVAYGASLRVLLWLWIGLSAAGGFLLLARTAPWSIALLATALLLWIDFAWFPRRVKVHGIEAKLSLWLTPAVVWVLNYLHPVLDHTLGHIARRYPEDGHTNIFETDDLLALLERQSDQKDNRIDAAQLERIKQALSAHKYKVGDVLTSRAEVKSVSDADTIGLVLLDELHESGQSSFPVQKGKTDKIIGTLYLRDLSLQTEGKVRDYMQSDVRYLHEDDSLEQALQAFFKTKHQLFVVVNSFEEYVGIATLEQIMQQLTGKVKPDGFDQHESLAAVAARHNQPEAEPEPESEGEPEAPSLVEEVVPEVEEEITPQSQDDDFEAIEDVNEDIVQPDGEDLAALDLPDEEPEQEEPQTKRAKSKTAKSDDEVVE